MPRGDLKVSPYFITVQMIFSGTLSFRINESNPYCFEYAIAEKSKLCHFSLFMNSLKTETGVYVHTCI